MQGLFARAAHLLFKLLEPGERVGVGVDVGIRSVRTAAQGLQLRGVLVHTITLARSHPRAGRLPDMP